MPLFEPSIQTISAGTTWATGRGISFADGNGISFGIVGNTITATVGGGGGSSAGTISLFSQWGGFGTNYYLSNNQISFQKVSLPMAVSVSTGIVLAAITGHSNSSGGITILVGAYKISGQTASSVSTASAAITWVSGNGTASSVYGGISGTRYRAFDFQSSLPPGDYLFAFAISASNDGTMRIFGRQGVNIVGSFAGLETVYFIDGYSISTAAALPTSVVATDTGYARTGVSALQQPGFYLIGTH